MQRPFWVPIAALCHEEDYAVICDCGTNFVGANTELRKLLLNAKIDYTMVADQLANQGTRWHFNPPAALHFGGLWEAGVKCAKTYLKKVIGDTLLCFEVLATLLSQIEASTDRC